MRSTGALWTPPGDASSDAAPVACPTSGAPVSTITVSGTITIAYATHVPIGTVTVTASASGRTFYPHDLDVAGGDDVIITDERSP